MRTIDRKPAGYLRSSTFWVLTISAPILWALVYYLLAQIFTHWLR